MFEIVIRNKRIIIKILNRNSVLRWVQFREPYLEVVQNSGEKILEQTYGGCMFCIHAKV